MMVRWCCNFYVTSVKVVMLAWVEKKKVVIGDARGGSSDRGGGDGSGGEVVKL